MKRWSASEKELQEIYTEIFSHAKGGEEKEGGCVEMHIHVDVSLFSEGTN